MMVKLLASKISLALVCVLLVSSSGCSGEDQPLGTISGHITHQGNSFDNCKVGIYNAELLVTRGARVDAQGAYKFKDVVPGDYVVMVLPPALEDDREVARIPIPKKLTSRKTTDLSVTVTANQNSELNVELSP